MHHFVAQLDMFLATIFSTLAIFLAGALRVQARPESYAVWAADSAIARKQGNGYKDDLTTTTVSYEHGELQWGLRLLYEATGNQTYYDYLLAAANVIVNNDGKIVGSDYKYVHVVDDMLCTDIFIGLLTTTKILSGTIAHFPTKQHLTEMNYRTGPTFLYL